MICRDDFDVGPPAIDIFRKHSLRTSLQCELAGQDLTLCRNNNSGRDERRDSFAIDDLFASNHQQPDDCRVRSPDGTTDRITKFVAIGRTANQEQPAEQYRNSPHQNSPSGDHGIPFRKSQQLSITA